MKILNIIFGTLLCSSAFAQKVFIKVMFFSLLLAFSLSLYGQKGAIMGQVSNQYGAPMSFATVALEGSKLGTNTDDNGKFMIRRGRI